MTRVPSHRNGLAKPDQKFLSDIEEYGWHVTHVLKSVGKEGPNWSFSCGLFFTFQHPEIVIFGLHSDTLHLVINDIGNQVKGGAKFESGREYGDILTNYPVTFRVVATEHYGNYLGFAIWFYESDPFPVLQCFWPDKSGYYPWDPRCDAEVRNAQPFLFKPC